MHESKINDNDEEYFLFEFPKKFDVKTIKTLNHKDFNISEDQSNDYIMSTLNDNTLSNKGKVVLFEKNGKLKFKEVKKFIKVIKKAETPLPSYKNVLYKKKKI
jgi:hypothetical protein